jgi:hypothetical protein
MGTLIVTATMVRITHYFFIGLRCFKRTLFLLSISFCTWICYKVDPVPLREKIIEYRTMSKFKPSSDNFVYHSKFKDSVEWKVAEAKERLELAARDFRLDPFSLDRYILFSCGVIASTLTDALLRSNANGPNGVTPGYHRTRNPRVSLLLFLGTSYSMICL